MLPPDLVARRVGNLTILPFPAARLSVLTRPIDATRRVVPIGPGEVFALAPGAVAALDGPMFGHCVSGTSDASSQCDTLDYAYADPDAGVQVAGVHSGSGITISVVGERVAVHPGNTVQPGARAAVQLYPSLVEDGRNVASNAAGTNGQSLWRAALVALDDTTLAFAVENTSMREFAQHLIDVGARYAGYTDGGGSTALLVGAQRYGSSEGRRVASWLVVDPPSSGLLWAGLAAAVGGGVYWWMTRKTPRSNPSPRRARANPAKVPVTGLSVLDYYELAEGYLKHVRATLVRARHDGLGEPSRAPDALKRAGTTMARVSRDLLAAMTALTAARNLRLSASALAPTLDLPGMRERMEQRARVVEVMIRAEFVWRLDPGVNDRKTAMGRWGFKPIVASAALDTLIETLDAPIELLGDDMRDSQSQWERGQPDLARPTSWVDFNVVDRLHVDIQDAVGAAMFDLSKLLRGWGVSGVVASAVKNADRFNIGVLRETAEQSVARARNKD